MSEPTEDAERLFAEGMAWQKQRIEKLEAEVSDGCDLIRWIAQTVHQGYHADLSGTFSECPKSICAAARDHLAAHQAKPEEKR